MSNNTSMATLVGALVGAGAYGPATSAAAVASVPLRAPLQAISQIQHARVEIYCGHNAQAVADIRAASQQLRSAGRAPSLALAMLGEAAWLARQNQYERAAQALEAALLQIDAA